jgi:hypothetical protein
MYFYKKNTLKNNCYYNIKYYVICLFHVWKLDLVKHLKYYMKENRRSRIIFEKLF